MHGASAGRVDEFGVVTLDSADKCPGVVFQREREGDDRKPSFGADDDNILWSGKTRERIEKKAKTKITVSR